MSSFFSHVIEAPPDSILGLTVAFLKDPREKKVNLSAGIYKTEDGKTPVLACVKESEALLLEKEETKNYLPIEGDPSYLREVSQLVFGKALYPEIAPALTVVQSIGGAGALRLGAEFLFQSFQQVSCYIPDPTWPNHQAIFRQANLQVGLYPYYDFSKKGVAFEEMMAALSKVSSGSVVLFHVNCHNPSGADLRRQEWELLADLCLERRLLPFFDGAYLGFDSTFEEDAFPLRLFAKKGVQFLASISFSKSFSLYAERVGVFFLFSGEPESPRILSQLKLLVRRNYSNPPLHGAKVVSKILETPALRCSWEAELQQMKERIGSLRSLFVSSLAKACTRTDYSYLLDKKGLFSFCNLSKEQVRRLQEEFAIYMTSDGRVNVAGLSRKNVDEVSRAIAAVGG